MDFSISINAIISEPIELISFDEKNHYNVQEKQLLATYLKKCANNGDNYKLYVRDTKTADM